MLHPSYYDLMEVVNSSASQGEEPVVSSRYSIVIATSKRARQIIDGDEAMVPGNYKKPLSLAVDEIYQSKVKILPEGAEINDEIILSEEEEFEDSEADGDLGETETDSDLGETEADDASEIESDAE